jgi:hypothetical protein
MKPGYLRGVGVSSASLGSGVGSGSTELAGPAKAGPYTRRTSGPAKGRPGQRTYLNADPSPACRPAGSARDDNEGAGRLKPAPRRSHQSRRAGRLKPAPTRSQKNSCQGGSKLPHSRSRRLRNWSLTRGRGWPMVSRRRQYRDRKLPSNFGMRRAVRNPQIE